MPDPGRRERYAIRLPKRANSDLVGECREHAVALLKRNLAPAGILAATPAPEARARGYAAVFGRDAAICALGMAVAPDATLRHEAAAGLLTLARHQAQNGQIPKFVDPAGEEADFWYLGCIDATLWWLIAVALLDRSRGEGALRQRLAPNVERAIVWLSCQEHQRFRLLQQNEASDWADIMPRSGFVLYTNALWYVAKRLYRLPNVTETHRNFNQLFQPSVAVPDAYRRARLLVHYPSRRARRRELFLSFVNFSFFGDEGDVFGNVLAILGGLTDEAASHRILHAIMHARADEPYPARVVCAPITQESMFWRPYMSRHRQNFAWQYHNGGIWPFVGAFWALALAHAGLPAEAEAALVKVAQANALAGWSFTEWLHGRTYEPRGMRGQSWNAAAFLLAEHHLRTRARLFPTARPRPGIA